MFIKIHLCLIYWTVLWTTRTLVVLTRLPLTTLSLSVYPLLTCLTCQWHFCPHLLHHNYSVLVCLSSSPISVFNCLSLSTVFLAVSLDNSVLSCFSLTTLFIAVAPYQLCPQQFLLGSSVFSGLSLITLLLAVSPWWLYFLLSLLWQLCPQWPFLDNSVLSSLSLTSMYLVVPPFI